jgi:hypothetical protein
MKARLDGGNTGSEAGEKSERFMEKKWEMYVGKKNNYFFKIKENAKEWNDRSLRER